MKRILSSAVTTALALLLAGAGTTPASAATYKYDRQNACRSEGRGECSPGIVVKHWHKGRSADRGVAWVYASMATNKPTAQARWLYQRPGGRMTAATGWKQAKHPAPGTNFVETSWGRDGRTGPQHPVGTRVCVEFRDLGRPLCVRLR
ncbi:hypothetical protein ACFFTQ_00330 [Streptomyces roseofulvus]|uniref:hypothetical protein n=1 Tax=Streptomyces roseofulvus TaxID=33902 RepID=UPI0031F7435C